MISIFAALVLQTASLPSCADLEYGGTHQDCVLTTADGATATFTFEPGEWGESGILIVTNAEGDCLWTDEFETESFFYPRLEDLDGNGFDDILVPLITGNVNTEMLLIMGGERGYTVASREISGHTFEAVAPGLFVVQARSSAIEHYASFYAWDGEALDLEAAVSITFDSDESATCTLATGAVGRGVDFYCAAVMNQADSIE
ncbi:hypothetical protein L5876_05105 [Hyphobacterium sp. SN044]|uniref:hypothetical protein n=1 Tax=Hyphobacterium sp. SN044 TaxID=2912575 RepID=UPI001F371E42|nr:hypothetical protein [Hyphobacterium sp. SN044]MCF8879188.1 hypothetical protein [Hyphobacterium sp. SN044]